MPHRTIRLLVTGDLHLGRFPARAPLGDPELSVEHVWSRIVEYAVSQRMDAVVLTGDVVDRENRFFESFGPLRRGLERLGAAGIPSFAVAGNHDYDVLPVLHDALRAKGFHLVGRGGSWETVPLVVGGETVLNFAGWSFPNSAVSASPLLDLEVEQGDVPVIGLVHGDLNQKESRYAPLLLPDLNAAPVAAWLLGHIHKPGLLAHRDGVILYPGSPQPLNPKESGDHGPWIVEVEPGGRVRAEAVALATLRYEVCDVDLEDIASADEFRGRVIASLEDHLRGLAGRLESLKHVVYTLRYVGRTSLHRSVENLDAQVRNSVPAGILTGTVIGSTIETRPAIDLEKLARGNDPLGVLAKLILDLDSGQVKGDAAALVRRAGDEMDLLHRKPAFSPLRSQSDSFEAPEPAMRRALLRDQAFLLLDELHSQKRVEASHE